MKCRLLVAIFLILFPPLNADTFDEIEAKRECDKWVHEGGTYLIWKKDWKQVDGGMQRKWKIKRVSKRDGQIYQLSIQLIIKRTFLFKPQIVLDKLE